MKTMRRTSQNGLIPSQLILPHDRREATTYPLKDKTPERTEPTTFALRESFKIELKFRNRGLNPQAWLFDLDKSSSEFQMLQKNRFFRNNRIKVEVTDDRALNAICRASVHDSPTGKVVAKRCNPV
jgi:hypothetical protein